MTLAAVTSQPKKVNHIGRIQSEMAVSSIYLAV